MTKIDSADNIAEPIINGDVVAEFEQSGNADKHMINHNTMPNGDNDNEDDDLEIHDIDTHIN